MLKSHDAFLLAENIISLYILSLGVLALAGIFTMGQQQLHRQEQKVKRYVMAEQVVLEVPIRQLTEEKIQVDQHIGGLKMTWLDQTQISCYVQD